MGLSSHGQRSVFCTHRPWATLSSVAPKLLDQKSARRLLGQHGWRMTRGGKHVIKMEKEGMRPITLPRHRGAAYSRGLTAAILKQAGLD